MTKTTHISSLSLFVGDRSVFIVWNTVCPFVSVSLEFEASDVDYKTDAAQASRQKDDPVRRVGMQSG